eukprot:TRINITY_DN15596_c0_g1_i1.p1 TRINITY_DN15596_c0_g1~~TRINITY_DN15596_c0_g1_i1.p1  ORF type:complete len:157 (-),score=24.35 TRINITY_DN15596_c0_g1_i1:26-496(-)
MQLTLEMLPLMRDNGRIVFLSSRLGQLGSRYAPELRRRFLDSKNYIPEITSLTEEFLDSIKGGTWKEGGWPTSSYQVSKAAVNAAVRALVKYHDEVSKKGLLVLSTCPGWCRTDMGGSSAHRSSEDGADTPVWCATTDARNLDNGAFYGERKKLEF